MLFFFAVVADAFFAGVLVIAATAYSSESASDAFGVGGGGSAELVLLTAALPLSTESPGSGAAPGYLKNTGSKMETGTG